MQTGVDYRITSTLDNLELAYWVQYSEESLKQGSQGVPLVLHYWIIFQNRLLKLDQSEAKKLLAETHGMHSHSLKLALHRLLVNKCNDPTSSKTDRNFWW